MLIYTSLDFAFYHSRSIDRCESSNSTFILTSSRFASHNANLVKVMFKLFLWVCPISCLSFRQISCGGFDNDTICYYCCFFFKPFATIATSRIGSTYYVWTRLFFILLAQQFLVYSIQRSWSLKQIYGRIQKKVHPNPQNWRNFFGWKNVTYYALKCSYWK